MSSSHLFLGLRIALSAAFFSHLSLGDVAILSANFHFIFCGSCSSIESLRVPSCPMHLQCFSLCTRSSLPLQSQLYPFPHQDRLLMSLHCPTHFCGVNFSIFFFGLNILFLNLFVFPTVADHILIPHSWHFCSINLYVARWSVVW